MFLQATNQQAIIKEKPRLMAFRPMSNKGTIVDTKVYPCRLSRQGLMESLSTFTFGTMNAPEANQANVKAILFVSEGEGEAYLGATKDADPTDTDARSSAQGRSKWAAGQSIRLPTARCRNGNLTGSRRHEQHGSRDEPLEKPN
jgi:hypothetical protein